MTEQEYLDLKSWVKKNQEHISELYEKLPKSNSLTVPSFDLRLKNDHAPNENQIKRQKDYFEIVQELSKCELDNEIAIDLLRAYEAENNINE